MIPENGQCSDSDSTISPELERELDKIYVRHHLAQESQDLIRCLGPGDIVEVFHSAGEPSYPGTVVLNDGNTIVIGCSLFNNPGEGNLEFDVETACSRECIDDPDGPFYFEFAIPKPFNPIFIDINSTYELACPTHEKSSIPDLVALKEFIRQAFIIIMKEALSFKGEQVLLGAYIKQLRKGDKVRIGVIDSRGGLIYGDQSRFFKAFEGNVKLNDGFKVEISSKHFENKKKQIGRRSFNIVTGESLGPAFYIEDWYGMCFYFIELPPSFLPDSFMKVIELGPENLTILSEKQKDTFMDDFPF